MNRKIKLTISIILVGAIAAGGVTLAAFQTATSTTEQVTTTEIGIDIVQEQGSGENVKTVSGAEGFEGITYRGMPGDIVDEKIYVKNTKSQACYVRVTINRFWLDAQGERDRSMPGDDTYLNPREIDIMRDNDDWLVIDGDEEYGEVLYCYYRRPLEVGENTANVMDQFSILAESASLNNNKYVGYGSQITFDADAIQTIAVQDAMLAEWGVKADIENGVINSVAEQ